VQTITLLNKVDLMHLPHLTSVWRQRIERRSPAGAVEQQRRRRPTCAHDRAVAEEACTCGRAEEAGSSNVDSGSGGH
jgi:hypothetical protein